MALVERKITYLEWDKPGVSAAGFLLSTTRNKYKDGSVGLTYRLRDADGSVVVFKGATRLNDLISPQDIGTFIEVKYLGEDATKQVAQGMNRPKLFRLSLDSERTLKISPNADDYNDPGITDEDIPF